MITEKTSFRERREFYNGSGEQEKRGAGPMNLETLQQQIDIASENNHKLVLVVGYPGSGKSNLLRQLSTNSYVNLNKELSVKLLPIPKDQRASQVLEHLRDILSSYPDPLLVLDNIGILFLPELKLDPLKALAELSRDKTLVVAWIGRFDGRQLIWDDPGHRQQAAYAMADCPYPMVALAG